LRNNNGRVNTPDTEILKFGVGTVKLSTLAEKTTNGNTVTGLV
jgi:hypothetical protein